MTITLIPPLGRSGAPWLREDWRTEALTEGPAFVRSDGMSRWHRTRSGTLRTRGGEEHVSYQVWCGQFVYASRAMHATDSPTDSLPICGTCDGRALGADPNRPDRIFVPLTLAPPRFCPNRTLFEPAGSNVGRCQACGELAPVKVHGWNGTPKLQQHVPFDLVPGCPFHAWRSLVVHAGLVMCRCQAPSPYAVAEVAR